MYSCLGDTRDTLPPLPLSPHLFPFSPRCHPLAFPVNACDADLTMASTVLFLKVAFLEAGK